MAKTKKILKKPARWHFFTDDELDEILDWALIAGDEAYGGSNDSIMVEEIKDELGRRGVKSCP
jgi:hypothetical protein